METWWSSNPGPEFSEFLTQQTYYGSGWTTHQRNIGSDHHGNLVEFEPRTSSELLTQQTYNDHHGNLVEFEPRTSSELLTQQTYNGSGWTHAPEKHWFRSPWKPGGVRTQDLIFPNCWPSKPITVRAGPTHQRNIGSDHHGNLVEFEPRTLSELLTQQTYNGSGWTNAPEKHWFRSPWKPGGVRTQDLIRIIDPANL
ncbi:hypothetical protein RRG08_037843 [Elysia crispata]|uniref:Uncharacterized protein n=1 Tax=Elysia crispata TaxID=231223 RepID=A0AAE0ZK46_9GAST|nr:hypothetical protein RRG08_037843 [Elysia crispata]